MAREDNTISNMFWTTFAVGGVFMGYAIESFMYFELGEAITQDHSHVKSAAHTFGWSLLPAFFNMIQTGAALCMLSCAPTYTEFSPKMLLLARQTSVAIAQMLAAVAIAGFKQKPNCDPSKQNCDESGTRPRAWHWTLNWTVGTAVVTSLAMIGWCLYDKYKRKQLQTVASNGAAAVRLPPAPDTSTPLLQTQNQAGAAQGGSEARNQPSNLERLQILLNGRSYHDLDSTERVEWRRLCGLIKEETLAAREASHQTAAVVP